MAHTLPICPRCQGRHFVTQCKCTTPAPTGDALKARIVQMKEALANGEELRAELLERATYLEAVDEGQLSTIERQSMATMYRAADYLSTRIKESK